MEFLNKLYESDYFGIGLFIVIAFLVISFLIVLFFGKRDEKKRNNAKELDNSINAFKDTTMAKPVEVSDVGSSIILDNSIEPLQSASPVINDTSMETVKVIEPVVMPEAPKIVEPIIPEVSETVTPIIPDVAEPIKIVEPKVLEPVRYEIPENPQVVEPIKINIPEEQIKVTPIEEVKPIVNEVRPVIVEPPVTDSFYRPIEKVDKPEITVPNVDFDALAKSISDELDELEEKSNEIKIENKVQTPTQFSSVYVNEPVIKDNGSSGMDLPTMKKEEIKPESYKI